MRLATSVACASFLTSIVLLLYLICTRRSRKNVRIERSAKLIGNIDVIYSDADGRRRRRGRRRDMETHTGGNSDVANVRHRRMLDSAWENIDDGRPMKALEAVLQVVRERDGEVGVWRTLVEAKAAERQRQVQQQHDEMAAKFEELCMDEGAASATPAPASAEMDMDDRYNESASLLAEHVHGGAAIIRSAAESETSFVCGRCGGVVAASRRDAHDQYWCPSLR